MFPTQWFEGGCFRTNAGHIEQQDAGEFTDLFRVYLNLFPTNVPLT